MSRHLKDLGVEENLHKKLDKNWGNKMSGIVKDWPQFRGCWQKTDKGQFVTHDNSSQSIVFLFLFIYFTSGPRALVTPE